MEALESLESLAPLKRRWRPAQRRPSIEPLERPPQQRPRARHMEALDSKTQTLVLLARRGRPAQRRASIDALEKPAQGPSSKPLERPSESGAQTTPASLKTRYV